jgi:pimeloyl-ACP methyl ester carboxylesterase
MKMIVDTLAVEYKDEGRGPIVLLLHGWMNSLQSFDAIAAVLSEKYRVVRLDLPGFGGSEMPPKPWFVGDYAKFVADFCSKLNIEPTALIGHSLGGRIILKGFADGSLSAQKAVLIASAGVAERSTLRSWSFKAIAKAGRAATAIPPFTRLRAKLRTRLYAAANSDYNTAGAMTSTYLNVIGENLAPLASLLKAPTLLIWGRDDKTTPVSEGERLHALIPDSKLDIVDGAGHFVHQEKPEEVARMISEFV